MSGWFLGCLAALCRLLVVGASVANESVDFDGYIARFNRTYVRGTPEYDRRHRIFQENVARQQELNEQRSSPDSALYGVNAFADLTEEEFLQLYAVPAKYLATHSAASSAALRCQADVTAPDFWDWRDKHVVTPVKNQENCGSCWAFSSVEVLETHWAIHHHQLYELSVQQVLDCTVCCGCNGGTASSAYNWMTENPGRLELAKHNPYTAKYRGKCSRSNSLPVKVMNFSICSIRPEDEFTLLKNIVYQHGPVSVMINSLGLKDYVSGIIQRHCGSRSTEYHSVALVGFDTRGETPFWIVRNSWGADFGEHGYFRMVMGKNICGMGEAIAYPIVA